jgi:hypothetical protein
LAGEPPASAPKSWTAEETAAERARCEVVLKGLDIVVVAAEPMRDGACGSPAPYELVSIGSSPRVTFSPAPRVTCDLVAGLHQWVLSGVQPAARKILGGPVVHIETMSDYSCRTVYGRRMARLSEHGKANALDIKNFHTDRGVVAEVLADWGMTQREIAARIAEAKAAEARRQALAAQQKAAATKMAADKAAPHKGSPGAKSPAVATAPQPEKSPAAHGLPLPLPSRHPLPLPSIGIVGGSDKGGTGFSFSSPSRLGGPKKAAPADDVDEARKAQFLHEVHASACTIFGTTLGPEANAAHRNHFHVDMAYRRFKKICD